MVKIVTKVKGSPQAPPSAASRARQWAFMSDPPRPGNKQKTRAMNISKTRQGSRLRAQTTRLASAKWRKAGHKPASINYN